MPRLYASKALQTANQRIITHLEIFSSTSKRLANEGYLYIFVKIFNMYIMFMNTYFTDLFD